MEKANKDWIRSLGIHDEDSLRMSVGEVSQVGPASESGLPSINPILYPSWVLGYRAPFQEYRSPYLVERRDYPSRYEVFIYGDGSMYKSDDVNDPVWKESLDIAFRGEKPTIVFTSEDWFRLRINSPIGNTGDFSQLLSPEETPKDRDDWYEFTDNYVPPVPVPVFKATRMILENGPAGKVMFTRTYRSVPYKWAAYLRAFSKRCGGMR